MPAGGYGQDHAGADHPSRPGRAADELLSRDPLALLIGTLFDQHMRRGSSDARRCD
jgi:hypothetical protein